MFGHYFVRREAQIRREAEIDRQLQSLPCSRLVNSHLFELRANNRLRVKEAVEGSIFSYSQIAETHFAQVDKELDRLAGILTSKEPCEIFRLLQN